MKSPIQYEGSVECPHIGRRTDDGWRPADLVEVFGPSDTKTPYQNRDTQRAKGTKQKPLPPGDMGLPYLRVGSNTLDPKAFKVAIRKLLKDPKERQAARESGHLVIVGECGAVHVHRASALRLVA